MSLLLENPVIQSLVNRISVIDYHKFGELGYLSKNVELLEGLVINKTRKSPFHSFVVNFVSKLLTKIFESKNFYVQVEQPITTFDSEPEPDVSVFFGNQNDYKNLHPTTARLVVEISLTTYQLDFQKQFIYAQANIFEYWLINLNLNEIEVYKNPDKGKYLERKIYRSIDSLEIEGTFIELKEFLQP